MLALRTSPAGFPMAPSVEEWEAFSPAERAAVVAALPGEVTYDEMAMPEGDRHFKAKIRALDALQNHFTRQRRRIYLAAELPIYYPAEPRFAPDLLAVLDPTGLRPAPQAEPVGSPPPDSPRLLDAEDVERNKWVVTGEGKGLDWVLEIHVGGDRKKDAELNVGRYARLGIPEYFLYDRARNVLAAYRLASPEARVYTPIIPNHGLYESRVLGLEIQVHKYRLRFYDGTALLLESEGLIGRLQEMYDEAQQRIEEEARRREEAEQLAEEEARRREQAEQEVARLREELERLKR
jgi:Uma2 family endonuclease